MEKSKDMSIFIVWSTTSDNWSDLYEEALFGNLPETDDDKEEMRVS